MKGPGEAQLHGEVNQENQVNKDVNAVDLGDDLAERVRTEKVLDYLEGGSESAVESRLTEMKKKMPELIVHSEIDELYPKL